MGIVNLISSKALGVPTIDTTCYDNVIVFLTKKGITQPAFSFLRVERSATNKNFYRRIYFGTGTRNSS